MAYESFIQNWSFKQKNLMLCFRYVAALLAAHVLLTDLPDRLRLLVKNVEMNVKGRDAHGSAAVCELTWGDDPDSELIEPLPQFVLGSDIIYSEAAVVDLLSSLRQLSGSYTSEMMLCSSTSWRLPWRTS